MKVLVGDADTASPVRGRRSARTGIPISATSRPRTPVTRMTVVTNIPTPYRIPVYERIDAAADVDLSVVYMAEREANRAWELPPTTVRSVTLRSRSLKVAGRYIHFTSGVWGALRRLRPEVVVTTGFNPPQLIAFGWAVLHRVPHVAQTDGTVDSEAKLTAVHRIVRRIVGRRSVVFVATSHSGLQLTSGWGRAGTPAMLSPLAVDNEAFERAATDATKDIDLLFSGQLSDVKDPLFALEAAAETARRLGRRLRVAVVGDGPLRTAVEQRAAALAGRIEVLLPGFQQQAELRQWYARARVFLFPTHWDPWGLVLNEALAAGVPAIASPAAGSAAEMLAGSAAGRIVPLERDAWASAAAELLSDDLVRQRAAAAAYATVAGYTVDAAARGLLQAARTAVTPKRARAALAISRAREDLRVGSSEPFVEMPTVRIAGVWVASTSLHAAVDEFLRMLESPSAVAVRFANAYSLALAGRDATYRQVLGGPGVNLPDGAPLARLVRRRSLVAVADGGRVRGPSFFTRVLDRGRAAGVRHYLLGASPQSLAALQVEVQRRYPGVVIAGAWSPPVGEPDERFLAEAEARIRAARGDVVWLGLGTPKQDFASALLTERVQVPVVGVGAAFDFVAGTTREAPPFLRDHGLEWLFRLCTEPRRLWRRYLFGNLGFLWAVLVDEVATRRRRARLRS